MDVSDEASTPTRQRVPLFRREPINPGEVLVEILAVVLGVLIALAIDRWHEGVREQQIVDSALLSIRSELDRNGLEAQEHTAHLAAMAEAMQASNGENPQQLPCMGYEGWAGIQLPMLLDTAYEVAIATQALAKMPYQQASQIGAAYGAQRYMQNLYDKAGELMLADHPTHLGTCIGISREVAYASAGLAKRYAVTLAALPDHLAH